MEWRSRLNLFFDNFEWKANVSGILVFGSYISGTETVYSDLNVHFVFDDNTDFRQIGARHSDGLLISYEANPAAQIRKFFEDELVTPSTSYITQFAAGEVFFDRHGVAATLKDEAAKLHEAYFETFRVDKVMSTTDKHEIWKMKTTLDAAKSNGRLDLDFMHHVYLNRLVSLYMEHIGRRYNPAIILGNVDDERFRKQYLLHRLPDPVVAELIASSITTGNVERKVLLFAQLVEKILEKFGGFSIDAFRVKRPLDL